MIYRHQGFMDKMCGFRLVKKLAAEPGHRFNVPLLTSL